MTGCRNLFYSYTPCNNKVIKIADGSLSSVAGIGTIKLSQNLILKSVLHVLSLKCNLISVSKITQDNQCVAKFVSSSCFFQELSSGRMIGSARVLDGLYFFEDKNKESRQTLASGVASVFVSSSKEIML